MRFDEYRSGTHEAQREYRSFVPEPIGHEWELTSPALIEQLGMADRMIGELNAFAQLVPDIDFFIAAYVMKEAAQSSRIEGTQTNIEDAFKKAEDLPLEKRDDWQEVQNYNTAIRYAIERLETLPLSNRLLREVHAELMSGVRGQTKMPGEFRTSQNWIGASLKNAVFVPPHHERVPELMSDMELFLQDRSIHVPPLVRIAIAHYQFETIHPFLDGNGRLGRLMIPLYLASEGLLTKPALYLSDYFERNKTAYVDHLMAVREGHHMDRWLAFFLQGVIETAQSAIGVFQAILRLKARIDTDVLPRFSLRRVANAQSLTRSLYAQPIVESKDVAKLLDVTPTTANAMIRDLVGHGLLTEITGNSRNRLYVFSEYLALFRRASE